jgi:hypothetical protein
MKANDLSKEDEEGLEHLFNRKEAVKIFSHWSKQKLINHIIDLEKKINEGKNASLNSQIPDSNSVNTLSVSTKKNWPMAEKIYMIFIAQQKPLNREELNSLLFKLDIQFKHYKNPNSLISNYLKKLVSDNRIVKVKIPGFKNLYYFLPEWIDEDGKIKESYYSKIDLTI